MEEFSNRIENVIVAKLDLAIKTIQESCDVKTEERFNKVEKKHNSSEQQVQELIDKLEVNFNTTIEQMFQLQSQELNKMTEEKLDEKYKKVKEKLGLSLNEKINKAIDQILANQSHELSMKFKEFVNVACKEVLEEKIADLKTNESAAAEATVANLNRIEVRLDKLMKSVEDIETKLNREKPSKPRNTKGRYVNWSDQHEYLLGEFYISILELNNVIFKIGLAKNETEVRNVLMETCKVAPAQTVRFPDGEFLSLARVVTCVKHRLDYFASAPYIKFASARIQSELRELANNRSEIITLKSFENQHNLQWSYDDMDQS